MSLLKYAATVGSITMVSRVLGFVRDVLTANVVGTGLVAQAFVVAFRFPNLFRSLFAEGAFNSAFVPLFAKRLEGEGEASARSFAEDVQSVLLTWLLVFTGLAVVFMPIVIYAIAWGFAADPQKFDLTVNLTRIAFPYLLFMSLTALLSGVLNSLHRFSAAAAAPILLNVVMIVTLLVVNALGWGEDERTGYALVIGIFLSGIAQFLLLWIACARAGMNLRLRWPRVNADVRRLILLSVPGIIAGGITQVNLMVATQIASTFDRAVSYLYYADRVYQLPLGVVGVAIGVVLLPDMSRKLRAGAAASALASQNRALELALFLTLPATIALMVISGPIVHGLFEHGAFTSSDTVATSAALTAFAAGLPAFVLNKVFSPGFFAREDTSTPMRFAMASVAVNIVVALLLSRIWGHVGIAVATAAAAWVNASALGFTLARRGHYTPDQRLRSRLPRTLLCCLAMAVVLYGARAGIDATALTEPSHVARIAALVVLLVLGTVTYFLAAHFLKAMTFGELAGIWRPR